MMKSPTLMSNHQKQPHNDLDKRTSLASIAHDMIKNEAKSAVNIPKCAGCINCSSILTSFLEDCFYNFGLGIGKRPWLTIILSVALCLVCTAGLVFWNENTDDEELWTPYGSPFIAERQWILENFPKDMRYQTMILSSNSTEANVLTADTMRYLLKVHRIVENIAIDSNISYYDLCLEIPSTDESSTECATMSLLKLWEYNDTQIEQLNDALVLEAVTEALAQDLGPLEEIESILSGVEYDVVSNKTMVKKARGLMNIWMLKQNGTKEDGQKSIDVVAMAWEEIFIEKIIHNSEKSLKLPNELTMVAMAERSYDDGIDGAINNNLKVMFGGFSLIFFYIVITLGRYNCIEQRVLLSLMGMVVIVLALGASFGFCFYMGIFFADIHPVIPFLLLGIGVDDIYVIVQAVDNLSQDEKKLPANERVAKAMKHAGVSITVTSVTDMAALLISSTTSMPILRAFCLFAAMGVLFLYIFAITFFVGCLTLDERRQDARKWINFKCVSRKPDDWKPNEFSQNEFGTYFFKNILSPLLSKPIFKALVIIITLTSVGFGTYGAFNIELNYDSMWYMDSKGYQTKYYNSLISIFPEHGERVEVYVGQIPFWDYSDEMLQIEEILRNNTYIRNDSIEFWFTHFYKDCCGNSVTYCDDYLDWYGEHNCYDEIGFKRRLLMFLQENPFYAVDMKFNITLDNWTEDDEYNHYTYGDWEVTANRARFQHSSLENTSIKFQAMTSVKTELAKIVFNSSDDTSNVQQHPIAYTLMYVQWEANEVISDELIRNLSLTFGTIAFVSLLLIANIQVCILVFLSVVFTVINVCGFAHYMGLTIEIVTSIILILTVGLALDYAAHVGVVFACLKSGTRQQKMQQTLENIGPAVLNGGLSTFLAFVLLAFSNSYVFLTFFKMFGMVVVFGLFNGLFFLPVLLSLIGPGSNNSHHPENSYDVNNSSCSSPSKNDDQQSESLPPRLELNTDL